MNNKYSESCTIKENENTNNADYVYELRKYIRDNQLVCMEDVEEYLNSFGLDVDGIGRLLQEIDIDPYDILNYKYNDARLWKVENITVRDILQFVDYDSIVDLMPLSTLENIKKRNKTAEQ